MTYRDIPLNQLRKTFRRESRALQQAIQRCHNPNHLAYYKWGARGVEVAEEWRDGTAGFDAFMQHMGPQMKPKLMIARYDTSKGYFPGNVFWATYKDLIACYPKGTIKGDNNPLPITISGETKTAAEWSKLRGVSSYIIARRYRAGRRGEDLFSKSKARRGPRPKLHSFKGEQLSLADIADRSKLSLANLRSRLANGLTLEQATTLKPYPPHGKKVTIDGVTKTVREWSREHNVNPSTFHDRLQHGCTGRRLLRPSRPHLPNK